MHKNTWFVFLLVSFLQDTAKGEIKGEKTALKETRTSEKKKKRTKSGG